MAQTNGLLFSTPVSAITAYTSSINSDAKNLSAVGAVAGKEFSNLIFSYDTAGALSGASSYSVRNLDQVGLPVESNVATNFSIGGRGFAVVRDQPGNNAQGIGNLGFVRNCTFYVDQNGDLVNTQGQFLQVFLTDSQGAPLASDTTSVSALQTLNINSIAQSPVATNQVSINTLLSSTDSVGNTFNQVVAIYDSLGREKSLNLTFTKTSNTTAFNSSYASQAWNVSVSVVGSSTPSIAGPYNATTGGMRIEFGNTGNPVAFNTQTPPNSYTTPPVLTIDWGSASGARPSQISLDFGAVNTSTGVLSVGSTSQTRSFTKNGFAPGVFKSLAFDQSGYGIVTFSNGENIKYCRAPLALFPNERQLSEQTAGVFVSTASSGNYTLSFPGQGNAGQLVPGTYESSTANGTSVYVQLIEDQKNLLGNFKTIETMKRIYDRLQDV